MSELFDAYAVAAGNFRKACKQMQAAAEVVTRGAVPLAKWREIDPHRLFNDAATDPQLSVWPSGEQLRKFLDAYQETRTVLKKALADMPHEQLAFVKTIEAIEAEAVAR